MTEIFDTKLPPPSPLLNTQWAGFRDVVDFIGNLQGLTVSILVASRV
jgi:hypothetical protein